MLADIVLGVAVLALLIYRQLRTRPVNASGLRVVAILGVIGLIETAQFLQKNHAGAATYAAIGQPGGPAAVSQPGRFS